MERTGNLPLSLTLSGRSNNVETSELSFSMFCLPKNVFVENPIQYFCSSYDTYITILFRGFRCAIREFEIDFVCSKLGGLHFYIE